MNGADWIISGILLLIVVLAVWYIRRPRKNGISCIGCASASRCAKSDASNKKTCCGSCASCSACRDAAVQDNGTEPKA